MLLACTLFQVRIIKVSLVLAHLCNLRANEKSLLRLLLIEYPAISDCRHYLNYLSWQGDED